MFQFVKTSPLLVLLVGGILLTLGDILFKKWVLHPSWGLYISGLALWLIALNALAYSFKFKNIAAASLILVIFNIVTLAIISAYYFKEPLSSKQLIGVVLGLTAVALLEVE